VSQQSADLRPSIFYLYFFHNFSNPIKKIPMSQIFLLFLLISVCLLMIDMAINADAYPDPAVEKIFLGPGRDRG
jgi:hypothetical protein